MIRTRLLRFAAVAALLTLAGVAAHACPNCKEAVMPGGEPVSSGFSTSIYLMMVVPFLLLGGFGYRIWHAARRQRLAEAAADLDSHTSA